MLMGCQAWIEECKGSACSDTAVNSTDEEVLLVTSMKSSRRRVTTDCATRLNSWSSSPAACVVNKDSKALLVYVPYGSKPGWDLPGGYNKDREPKCETAERETCEETGYSVRALKKLSNIVFECEVTGENVCTIPVDEGFLQQRWVKCSELDSIQYRGGTWGDKKGLLKESLCQGSSRRRRRRRRDPPVNPSACTGKGGDPWNTGAYIECCAGLQSSVKNWDGNGQWYYRCISASLLQD
eukprot:TRINITY_DN50754_c0_g1_i1.p1 TRINITY_DN50754_c0_g1~~TRINITY_DN50754_c0_g1_i1.p1  ORF type:complete len:271 (+),score=48.43 TRINITY_DN50754_c0_g1_i1:97-813(+)